MLVFIIPIKSARISLRQVLLACPEFYDHPFDVPPAGVNFRPLPFAGANQEAVD